MEKRVFKQRKKNTRAQALILGYVLISSLLLLLSPLFAKLFNEGLLTYRERLRTEAFYLAEGGIENTINSFMFDIANFQVSPDLQRYPASGDITTTYSSSTAFPNGAVVTSFVSEAESGQRLISDPDGLNVRVKSYIVNAVSTHPENSNISVSLNQVIKCRVIYTFQHAVFYNDDLEILPGPDMTFAGRVHSNQDMYLGTNNTLTIDSAYLRSAGDIYNRRKDKTENFTGDVRIKKAGTSSYKDMDGLDSDSTGWLNESQSRWNGTVKSSVHGVTELTTPIVGSVLPGAYYASNANLVITNGQIVQGGVILAEGVDIPAGTIYTDTDFYNNREGKYVKMTNIDMRKLAGYDEDDTEGAPSFSNQLPANGLIYATRDDAPSSQQPGIRITNAETIYRTDGLTLVSNDPVYVQGDFNTTSKKPVALITDAINILSNSWDDAKSTYSVNNRVASTTTVNSAFISGISESSWGHYNGGLENYPRMHETWSGKNLNITGSFVTLWESLIADGSWKYGAPQYTAPGRNWQYDTSFASGALPPFTPWVVEAERGAWWTD